MKEFDQATEERIKAEGESRQEEKRRVALAFDKEAIEKYRKQVMDIPIPEISDHELHSLFHAIKTRIDRNLNWMNY